MVGKDYYEILGVRPSAGPDEIQLAYKGRRSQYHPDRYSQADEETQKWANEKMQEVNEAFSVLKDDDERRRYDMSRAGPSARTGPPPIPGAPKRPESPKRPAAPERSSHGLGQVMSKFRHSGEPFQKVFIAPDIPMKKLAGALESYGHGLQTRDVIALIDDTAFGGAKEGVLITENEIISKAIFQSPQRWKIEDIEEVDVDGRSIFINGREFVDLNIPDKSDVRQIVKLIGEYIRQREISEYSGGDVDVASGAKAFSELPQGVYARLERELRQKMGGGDGVEMDMAIAISCHALRLSLLLSEKAVKDGVVRSSIGREYVASDAVRMDCLILIMSMVQTLLRREAEMPEDDVRTIVGLVMFLTIFPYVSEVDCIGKRKTLRSVANPLEEIKNSEIMREFKRRMQNYQGGISGECRFEDHFEYCVTHLAVLESSNVHGSDEIMEFARQVCSDFDDDFVSDFVGDLLERVESMLIVVLEN